MSYKINNSDYKKILKYYKIKIPGTREDIKKSAENILSLKLCRCIKKMERFTNNEPRSIGICTQTVLNNKGLKRVGNTFRCKNPRRLTFKKSRRNLTMKKIRK